MHCLCRPPCNCGTNPLPTAAATIACWRHAMAEHNHLARLRALKLYGMAQAWGELQAEQSRQPLSAEATLLRLLDAEQADRQVRSLSYQMKAAHFPHHRDLAGFNWTESPLAAARIEPLAAGSYPGQAHNLILVGRTGTGKTHLANPLGVAAVQQGKRVRFYNAV